VQLLGLGSNGHVGFNEPPCGRERVCRVVELSEATRRQNAGLFGGDPAAVPPRAITLGLKEILAAEQIHLVVTGRGKAPILGRLLAMDQPDPAVPASWLLEHPQFSLWADADALSLSLA
jgi:glucosamine-6-phosphate deaminase